jgi:hypothetical protein
MRLAPLLKLLRANGVRSYTGKDFSLTFGGGEVEQPATTRKKLEPRQDEPPRDAMELALELSGRPLGERSDA